MTATGVDAVTKTVDQAPDIGSPHVSPPGRLLGAARTSAVGLAVAGAAGAAAAVLGGIAGRVRVTELGFEHLELAALTLDPPPLVLVAPAVAATRGAYARHPAARLVRELVG
ncbi:MAG TPA: hypothetical protein VGK35_14145 [Actinotalea sp.]|jgi:hypothetical protein